MAGTLLLSLSLQAEKRGKTSLICYRDREHVRREVSALHLADISEGRRRHAAKDKRLNANDHDLYFAGKKIHSKDKIAS